MLQWFRRLRRPLLRKALGQGLVEYALILALIAVLCIGVLSQIGSRASATFDLVGCTLDGGALASSSHAGNPQGNGNGLGNNTTTTGDC